MLNKDELKCDKAGPDCVWIEGEPAILSDGQSLCDKHYNDYIKIRDSE